MDAIVIRFPTAEELDERRRREAWRLVMKVVRENPDAALTLLARLDIVHPRRAPPA